MAKEITTPTEEQIRTRAYYLWEADGKPAGRDWDYWMKAQQELAPKQAPAAILEAAPAKKTQAAPAAATTKRRSNARAAAYA